MTNTETVLGRWDAVMMNNYGTPPMALASGDGAVVTDADGRTGVTGLWAAGEVARTGLHGANRLASNSLLEGLIVGRRAARDVVRAVQQARKDAGLDVSDRIALVLDGDEAVRAALTTHESLVAGEVRATSYALGDVAGEPVAVGEGNEVRFTVAKA